MIVHACPINTHCCNVTRWILAYQIQDDPVSCAGIPCDCGQTYSWEIAAKNLKPFTMDRNPYPGADRWTIWATAEWVEISGLTFVLGGHK